MKDCILDGLQILIVLGLLSGCFSESKLNELVGKYSANFVNTNKNIDEIEDVVEAIISQDCFFKMNRHPRYIMERFYDNENVFMLNVFYKEEHQIFISIGNYGVPDKLFIYVYGLDFVDDSALARDIKNMRDAVLAKLINNLEGQLNLELREEHLINYKN